MTKKSSILTDYEELGNRIERIDMGDFALSTYQAT
jgi:hypothetical protein